ncbi:DNA modification methylase [Phocaeicola coprocola]|uniref:DNA modification methylase n=1 Tax=Phocaeicola coprocola TaxID=310298 RepID=UPI002943ACFE|nr:DNA modification methylase [Phocaeicola coprocola]
MEVIYRSTETLKKLEDNPRTITPEDMERLKESISNNPDYLEAHPIVLSDRTGELVIIDGNQRYEACVQLGMSEVPTSLLHGLTEEREREIIIRANVLNGKWDEMILKDKWDIEELKDWGVDLPADWDTSEADEQKEAEEDNFSEEDAEQAEPRVKLGEIWQLGEHRLMCGDSTDANSVALLMDGEKADMVFTDPPYGVSIGDKNKALNRVQKAGRCTENIANDNISVDDLYPILVKAMTNCRENCKDCACYYVTSPQGGELGLMMMMMKDAGLPVRHMLIWEKNSATFILGRLDYDYQHEPIFYTWTKSHKNYRNGEFRTTIWKYDKPRKCDLHPTMKPVELVENCMMDASVEGDIVLDMFGGSGTTMIAAEQLGRKARLMELDPHYCDVIIARWEKLTGKEAVKVYG